MTTVARKPCPGDVWFDRDGHISSAVPATYVLLSAERIEQTETEWEWKAALFRACHDGWMGAQVVTLWDSSIAKLEYIGTVQANHLEQPEKAE